MSGFQGYDQWKTASPYDDEGPCEVCGKDTAICECPECPICSEHGNPKCAINKDSIKKTGHAAALALMDELSVDNLFSVYRSVYKYTDCGPSIGFLVSYVIECDNGEAGPGGVADEQVSRWIYCDDLMAPLAETPYRLTREFMNPDDPCVGVRGISVGSIVEGVDYDCDTIKLEDDEFTTDAFWEAVESVNKQADEIWKETHGCDDCFDYPEGELHPIDPDCDTCHGEGAII